jgi:hypothetical protein
LCLEMTSRQTVHAAQDELPRRKRRGITSFLGKRIAASREVSDPIGKNDGPVTLEAYWADQSASGGTAGRVSPLAKERRAWAWRAH